MVVVLLVFVYNRPSQKRHPQIFPNKFASKGQACSPGWRICTQDSDDPLSPDNVPHHGVNPQESQDQTYVYLIGQAVMAATRSKWLAGRWQSGIFLVGPNCEIR